MFVLDRTKFQQVLARYPDDRRRVLRLMLSACVENREVPFSRGEICQMVARKRQVPILSVLDESDGIGREELVEVLLDRMDQPLVDQSIMLGCESHLDTPGSIKSPRSFPRLRRRRSLSRTPSFSSGAESILSVLAEYQRGMETQFDAFGLRMQELERNQSQAMDLLRRVASQLTSPM